MNTSRGLIRQGLRDGLLHHQAGFTLIELLVVLVILGTLAGMVLPRIMGRTEEARRTKALVQMQNLETALQLYRLDNGTYPGTDQGLQALVDKPTLGRAAKNWRLGGYLEKGKRLCLFEPRPPWRL